MKKYIIAACVLLVVAVCGIVWGHQSVNDTPQDVTVTESTLYGDKTAAEGIRVTSRAEGTGNWTCITSHGKELVTEVEFRFKKDNTVKPEQNSVELWSALGSGDSEYTPGTSDLSAYNHPEELLQAFTDVTERTKAGETNQEFVNLREYMEFFPLTLHITENEYTLSQDLYREENQSLFEFLHMPLPDTFLISIEVTKDAVGNVTNISYDANRGFHVATAGFIGEEYCYLAVNGIGDEDQGAFYPVEEAHRGILELSIDGVDENWKETPVAKLLYPISAGVEIADLKPSRDGRDLLLLTIEEKDYYLSVIDKTTGELKQKLMLLDNSVGIDLSLTMIKENFYLVLLMDGHYAAVQYKDGTYTKFCEASFETAEIYDKYQDFYIQDGSYDAVFDGERLAVVTLTNGQHDYPMPSYYLQVCDKGGLVYAGRYDNSLERKISGQTLHASYDDGVDVDFVH